jgi:valyl-tRNA synthetase
VDAAIDAYDFGEAAQALHRFTWSELCDWGLEMAKGRLQASPQEASDAANVLAWILERTLRLLHPLMPFVTEEIWQRLGSGESIVVADWPEERPGLIDADVESSFAFLQEVVTDIRALQTGVPVQARGGIELDASLREAVEPMIEDVQRVSGAKITFADLEGAKARLKMAEGVDLEPIVAQKRKRLAEVRQKLDRKRGKLANEGFLAKAPADIVEGERSDVASLKQDESRLLAELAQLGAGEA